MKIWKGENLVLKTQLGNALVTLSVRRGHLGTNQKTQKQQACGAGNGPEQQRHC